MHTIGKNQSLQLKYIITLDAFIEKDLQIRNTTSILKTFPTESNIGSSICAHSPVKRRREWPCLLGRSREEPDTAIGQLATDTHMHV